MKKTFFSFITVLSLLSASSIARAGGGCPTCTATIDTNCTGFLGDVCNTLPAATAGTFYSASLTINLVGAVDLASVGLPIVVPTDEAKILDVTGLPAGLTWDCSNRDSTGTCRYLPQADSIPSQFECISICGTPCGPNDTFDIIISMQYDFTYATFHLPLPISFNVPLVLNSSTPKLEIASESNFLCPSSPGDTLELEATAGFISYSWSTGSSGTSILVSDTNTYSVSVTDNLGCVQTVSKQIKTLGVSVSGDTAVCPNTIIQLKAEGGDAFAWTPSANLSSTAAQNPVVVDLQNSATYTVNASNQYCAESASITVTVDGSICSPNCTPCDRNASQCTGLTTPSPCNSLPPIQANVPYEEALSIFFPTTIGLGSVLPIPIDPQLIPGLPSIVEIESVVIDDITNLPPGLDWECDQVGNGCAYYPRLFPSVTQFGCIKICGTTCGNGEADSLHFEISVTITLDLAQNVIDLIDSVAGGFNGTTTYTIPFSTTISYLNDLEITPAGPIQIIQGSSITLNATSTSFTGHAWSNGATGSSITVNTSANYTVQATGSESCLQTASVLVTVVVGIEDVDAINRSLSIYPNPNNGICEVSFDLVNSGEVTLGIFTIEGKEVLSLTQDGSSGKNVASLDLTDFSKGTYFVKVSTTAGSVNRKISVY